MNYEGWLVTTCFLVTCALCLACYRFGKHEMQCLAVKIGHAEWVPQPDGSTVFRWKEAK